MIPQSFSNLIKISNNIIIKIKKKFDHKPIPLGRWNIIYDERVSQRVERANEDHCGPCGQLYLKNDLHTSNKN